MGALPESQVVAFLERLTKEKIGGEGADLLKVAEEALAEGNPAAAADVYAELLAQDSGNVAALAGLARCYVETGNIEQAKKTLAMVPEAKRNDASVAAVRATIELAEKAKSVGPLDELEKKGCRQSARSSGALRSRHRAQRREQARRGRRSSARDRQARPQMERRRRAQAAGAILRSLGFCRSGGGRRPQEAVVDFVFVSRDVFHGATIWSAPCR